jgi:hypothetical protein
MTIPTEVSYQYLRDLFSTSEKKIKQIENLFDQLAIPAVNELRYAGFHLIHAITASNPDEKQSNLISAAKHCRRSIYDSLEIGISFCIRQCSNFREDYRFTQIGGIVDGYAEDLVTITEIQDYIGTHNRYDSDDTDQTWNTLQHHFEVLLHVHKKWEASREEMNKTLRRRMIMLLVGILGLILTGLGLIIS